MTQGGVQHWLAGTRQPSLEDINRIAKILKVPPAWLTHGLEPDDMLDGLGDLARTVLRSLIHTERTQPQPEALWNAVRSMLDLSAPATAAQEHVAANVPPKLKQLLGAKVKVSTSDFAEPPPNVATTHEHDPPA